ncbi:MAG: hypothetical protein MMC23_000208 [Stictis urceolatum]|nr:hypothetical protein [Stictis urceolata]
MPAANPLADLSQLENLNVPAPSYPCKTKQASATVAGVPTDVVINGFSDKIMVMVSQAGRLGMWLQVPLNPTSPAHGNTLPSADDDDLLPLTHLTPQPLLGAANSVRQTTGQLLAAQIASTISARNPDEGRSILVGLGLEKEELMREGFVDLLEAVGKCL